jgi:ribosomal protein S6--L-glutamate ligase
MPAGSLEQVVFRMDVLHRLVAAGVPVWNPPRALEAAVDKYLACCRLEAAGLPVPPTVVCENSDAALDAFAELGGDVVVKPIFGSEGKGITRVNDADVAHRVLRTLERIGSVLYLQKFIEHEGFDLRAFVLGERVLTAMRRLHDSDWRTNVARGAKAEPIELTAGQAELAVRAARAVGAPIAGVDLLPGRDGEMYVLEVNAVPGWRALSKVTGVDVASHLLHFVEHSKSGTAER